MTNTFTLDPQPRSLSTLYACVSNYILESSTWMPQRHLKCSVARAGVLPSSGAPALLHASPLSVNDALTILLHKPQIYGASLMLSSPSPNVQSITQFTWFLSTECLFNPSTSVHVPWLPLDPAFFFFFWFLILTAAVASYLHSGCNWFCTLHAEASFQDAKLMVPSPLVLVCGSLLLEQERCVLITGLKELQDLSPRLTLHRAHHFSPPMLAVSL